MSTNLPRLLALALVMVLPPGVSDVEPGFAGSAQASALAVYGQRFSPEPAEIGAANALVFNRDGTVTAISERRRHGAGSALVQSPAH